MNRFRAFTAGALIVGVLGGSAAFAQGPRRGGPGGPGGFAGRGAGGPGGPGLGLPIRGLNLSEAQQQQIKDIREQSQEPMRELQARLRKAQEAQRDAVESVPVNAGLIRTTSQTLADVQADLALQEAQIYNQVWAVLTPAQQAEAKKLRAEREAKRDDRQDQRAERRGQRGNN